MSRNIRLYIQDILESISKIQKATREYQKADLLKNDIVFDGVILNLQIIGESVKQIPLSIREKYPQIDWNSIIGLRNIIAHTYFSLDPEIIWDITQTELNPLKSCIETIEQNEALG
ncbi:DUF86 domain-containing protein [Limnothrix sp. FACHB-1083]|uniref:HepT-like ribonuclease domain-containing protein n=1 Tax=unclassified Limnothrix TaxID=2632864 RepID=UPI00167FFC6A|nr:MULTISPECIES: DUF86 domain-containing protein [unclassified Limnothrix]MBD2160019.1 DUF86 domain-containing protein [Limnothrix sp. FACHB-1083]MBD2190719.1 DUF86 domain-containing protein [Limnothrix sp. FACHB-1088]